MALQLALGCTTDAYYIPHHRRCKCCKQCGTGGVNDLLQLSPIAFTACPAGAGGAYTTPILTYADHPFSRDTSAPNCGVQWNSQFGDNNAFPSTSGGTVSTAFGNFIKLFDSIFYGSTNSPRAIGVTVIQSYASTTLGLGWRLIKYTSYTLTSTAITGGWYTLAKTSVTYENSLGGTFTEADVPYCALPDEVMVQLCGTGQLCGGCQAPEAIALAGTTAITTGTDVCPPGIPVLDGTYGINMPNTCTVNKTLNFGSCTIGSTPVFHTVRASVVMDGPMTMGLTIPIWPRPGAYPPIPFPYATGVRILVELLYVGASNTKSTSFHYLLDLEECPTGAVEIPYIETLSHSTPPLPGAVAPSSVYLIFPDP